MWEISNLSQVVGFLYSIFLGAIYAILYDVLRSIRIIKSHTSLMVFIEDIVYFFVISVTTFIFFLSITLGEIRAYILIGILIGFLLFFILLSSYSLLIFTGVLKLFKRIFTYFTAKFYKIFDKIDAYIVKFSKNTLKCFKKVLKMPKVLVYTNRK